MAGLRHSLHQQQWLRQLVWHVCMLFIFSFIPLFIYVVSGGGSAMHHTHGHWSSTILFGLADCQVP